MLTLRLRDSEQHGITDREVYNEMVEWVLTNFGENCYLYLII
ncbi:winged helix-turn-helix transcriptional regulator (plasmid) [Bacillus paranthracis]|nr:winged helix-turn-helix transcriptional regulator [Bacillus anthracis]